MKRKKKNNKSKKDVFARIMAVVGIILSIISIIVPIIQDHKNSLEELQIRMHSEKEEYIRLSDKMKVSNVIQVPWTFTVSNVGKVKMSIVNLDIVKTEKDGAISSFSHLFNRNIRNSNGERVNLPILLDAGESKIIKIWVGFRAEVNILKKLHELFDKKGPITLKESFHYLAKEFGETIYGGKVSYKEVGNNSLISLDSIENINAPSYLLKVTSGRENLFVGYFSEYIWLVDQQ